jgi:hypothetical protein
MAFDINFLKSELQFGGARPTLFDCIITLPAVIPGDLSQLQFMCRATQIPASNLGLIQVPYFGRKIKLAGDRTFDPWQVTIINDEDFKIRNTLETWNYNLNLYQANVRTMQRDNQYKSDAKITQYGKDGRVLRIYTFRGIFPETISTIDLDWNANDQIEEFQVTWQYDFFTVTGPTSGQLVL